MFYRPIFFLRSSRIRINLLSYESKPTDKQEQYDWIAEKIGRARPSVPVGEAGDIDHVADLILGL